jgi:hypothetical protein
MFYKDTSHLTKRINQLIDQYNQEKKNLNNLFNYDYYFNNWRILTIDEKNDLLDELIFYNNLNSCKISS